MKSAKVQIVITAITAKICSILGYCVVVFFTLMLYVTINDIAKDGTNKTAGTLMCIFFISCGAILIFIGSHTKKIIKRYRKYVNLISVANMTSLDSLARNTGQSVDFVKKDIQRMIDGKLFFNAYIDRETDEIVIGKNKTQKNINQETESIICSGCGAMNYRLKGTAINCEYCGSLLE